MGVVIVGASLAGLRTAEALRVRNYGEPITMIGAEPGLPYDRPPLSKQFLAPDHSGATPFLRDAAAFAELDVELRASTRATGLDLDRRRVQLSDGDELPYEHLVIATGADARKFALGKGLNGFHGLRTVSDAEAIRRQFDRGPRVLVLGGGFIGAEVAAAARNRRLEVDLVEILPAPMSAGLGFEVGALLAKMHADNGVRVRCGVTVTRVSGGQTVEQVELSDGTVLDVDVVIVGLGVTPATEWLVGSGLSLDNGVTCDAGLRAEGRADVYAVGDVARWAHPLFERSMRSEPWTNANEHADVVASGIVGEPRVAQAVPYVWSDQYGHKIQLVGRPTADDELTVVEDPVEGRHLAVYERAGRVVGMLAIDSPRQLMRGRKAIAAGIPATELVAGLH